MAFEAMDKSVVTRVSEASEGRERNGLRNGWRCDTLARKAPQRLRRYLPGATLALLLRQGNGNDSLKLTRLHQLDVGEYCHLLGKQREATESVVVQ
jgi:hypothetical protein